MPLTRITVREGMSDARLQQLSDLYHQTLVEVFDVPREDKFQILEALPAKALVYHTHYQTGRRDGDFILFQILAGKPRSTAVKQRLYERLAERLHADLGIHPDNLMVVIQLNGSEEWSFGRGLMFRQEVSL
ncbi:tautomerase family protein [Aeromonas media]|uniref:tautomerase family protein n=1 Tax=Aeromonas media TaxID=651 RepID=UPI00143DEAAA|nr:tautomerase family protein [Aeromonas media]MBS4700265.1 tautomerase family protein [Aeromonas media]QIY87634.1 tautomerase family protein [Aeromonas hydrophila]